MVGEGCPGHGAVHLLSAGVAEIGFRWDLLIFSCSRPGLPLLCNLVGLVQHFKATILDASRIKVTADLCGREGFGVVLFWMFMALCRSLTLLMFGERNKAFAS